MTVMPDDNNLAYTLSGLGRRANPYDTRRAFARRLQEQGMDASPIQSPWQGVSRLAQTLAGAYGNYAVDVEEKKAVEDRNTKLAEAMSETDPTKRIGLISALDPEQGIRLSGQMAVEQAKIDRQNQGLQQVAGTYGGGGGAPRQGGQSAPAMAPEQAKAAAQQKIQYLVNTHGFTPDQAATMVGNLYQESKFNPTATHDGGTGYGLGGWRLERRDALIKEAQAKGEDPANPTTQLDFYANEFKTRPEFQKFQQAQTPEQRQAAMMDYFRPAGYTPQNPQGGHAFANRMQYAQQFGQGAQPQQQPGQPQPLQINMPGGPQGSADTNGMPPTPSPQGVQGPTMVAPPQIPQRMTPRDMPPQLAAPYVDRFRRGGYGRENPAQAEQAMVAHMQRDLDASFENQKLEYQRLQGDFEYNRKRGDDQTGANQKRGDDQTKQKFEFENKLRDDFNNARAAKAYNIAVPLVETAKDAATRTESRAADLNLINAFAKTMDPDSAVMSGERGEVTATASVAERVAAYVGQLNGQAQLSPNTRAKLIQELDSRFNSLKASYDAHEEDYKGIAERNGLNFDNIRIRVRSGQPAGRNDYAANAPTNEELKQKATGGGPRMRISLDGKPL